MARVLPKHIGETARMVEDFLVAARFDHDIAELETTDIEVMAAMRPLVDAARASGRGLQIDSRELWVKGDGDRIVHITRNLLSNHRPRWSEHSSGCAQKRGPGTFVIADDGPGIPSDTSDTLFEPFVNEGSRALITGSLGMGLAVARELAREMEGDLTLERTVDGWTCFSLSLPMGVPADLAAPRDQLVA